MNRRSLRKMNGEREVGRDKNHRIASCITYIVSICMQPIFCAHMHQMHMHMLLHAIESADPDMKSNLQPLLLLPTRAGRNM